MTSVRLPLVVLVPTEEADRLRRRLTAVQARERRADFWAAVQASKQPVLIQENPDTVPPYLRPVVDDEFCGPIG